MEGFHIKKSIKKNLKAAVIICVICQTGNFLLISDKKLIKMTCSIEELTLYAIIAFLLLENALELYLTKRQVNKNDLKMLL